MKRSEDPTKCEDQQFNPAKDGIVRTTCAFCLQDCGVLVHMKGGKVERIEGDPHSAMNMGALCPKGWASLEYLDHPQRIRQPLKRVGKRGEGKWEAISWDEALATIAGEMNSAKDRYGPESVVWLRGAAKGIQDNVFTRLANAFGSPNITSAASICYHPRATAMKLTFGDFHLADYLHPPSLLAVWAQNPAATSTTTYEPIKRALAQGMKLIVVDPFENDLTRRANLWIQPRPSTDLALALGMIHVIIHEKLYDDDFVEKWTVGFEELKAHVREYSPQHVSEITWVPVDSIVEAARLYGSTKPAAAQAGNGIEAMVLGVQTQRAIYIMEAICGNIGIPGGDVLWSTPPLAERHSPEFTLQNNIPKDRRDSRLGADDVAPFIHYALPQRVIKSLIDGTPSIPRVAYIQGANLLLSWANSHETMEGIRKLDFVTAADFFLTPTTQLCDIVLPVAHYLEHDALRHSGELPHLVQIQQRVVDPGECKSDTQILIELSQKLGLGEYFWKDEYHFLEDMLAPSGITFNEFRKIHVLNCAKRYRYYEKEGFHTPSGKVELYSTRLEECGCDPLPTYQEPPETMYSEPELANEYPLILTTRKPSVFRHGDFRQVDTLRAKRPDPILNMNPNTAKQLGIESGDWVFIENKRGRITHRAEYTESLHPKIVVADPCWWYPERPVEDHLHGFMESNINALTSNDAPYNPIMGSVTFRGTICKVYKARDK